MTPLAPGISRRWGIGLIGASLTVLVGLCCLLPAIGGGLVHLSYDLAFLFRADQPVAEAVVVYMDLESHHRLGQDKWQAWDRGLHARLIDRLRELGARAIVFDVVFLPDTNRPAGNAELIRAARQHGKVVVAALASPSVLEAQVVGWQLRTPFPELEAVASWGLVSTASGDSVIRKHYQRQDLNAPGLGWSAALQALGNPPSDPFRERWINYYGPPGMLPHHSFWEVLDRANPLLPAGTFSNRVVFVGAHYDVGPTGGKGMDDFPTPYSHWKGTRSPGVEINATTYLNLARGDWLERTRPVTELALIVIGGALFGLLLGLAPPLRAAGLGVIAAITIAIVANLAVWQTHVWFPWLILCAAQLPAAAGWSILAHTRRLTQEKRALEQALAVAQVREQAGPPTEPQAASPTASGPGSIQAGTIDRPRPEPSGLAIPDYTLVRKIGEGSYGEVWLARNIIGTYHAAKFVHRRHFAEATPFEREFHGIRQFTPISRGHAGLVQVLHIGRNESPEYIYYVMELGDDEVSGQSIDPQTYSPRNLAGELKKRQTLPLPENLRLCLQIAEALAYLHERDLIHRDIKPSNIIFVHGAAKLADIGLVTQVAAEGRDVSYLGTEGYIPPEGPGTPGADVYSLGKVIYQAATGLPVGRFPELPSAIMEGTLDEGFLKLNQIIVKACEVDPGKRYRSAADLHRALAALQQDLQDGNKPRPAQGSPR